MDLTLFTVNNWVRKKYNFRKVVTRVKSTYNYAYFESQDGNNVQIKFRRNEKVAKMPFFPTTYFGKSRSSKIRKNSNTNSHFFWEIAAYNPFLPAVFRFIYHLFLRHFLPIITTLWFEVTAIFQSFPPFAKNIFKINNKCIVLLYIQKDLCKRSFSLEIVSW